jgi:hypothetical protein
MMDRAFFIKNLWRWAAGLPELTENSVAYSEDLWKTEWSPRFEKLMRNRLVMGALRYGRLNSPGKPKYDLLKAIKARVDRYAETGNVEFLVDVANLALLEFEEGNHPNKHFAAIDDREDRVEVKKP